MWKTGERRFQFNQAEKNIRRQFGDEAFERLPRGNPAAAMALGGLLDYLYETQKTDLSHINDRTITSRAASWSWTWRPGGTWS